MRAFLYTFLMVIAVTIPGTVMAFDQSSGSGNTQVARYLESINFPSSYRQSIQRNIDQTGSQNAAAAQLSQLSDKQILGAVVPIVSSQLSEDDARILADFFSSDAGRAIAAHGQLTADQQTAVKQFLTEHGPLVAKMSQFFHNPDVQRQLVAALMSAK